MNHRFEEQNDARTRFARPNLLWVSEENEYQYTLPRNKAKAPFFE